MTGELKIPNHVAIILDETADGPRAKECPEIMDMCREQKM